MIVGSNMPLARYLDGPHAGSLASVPDDLAAAHVVLSGASGSGKSVATATWILKAIRDHGACVAAIDPKGEISQYLTRWGAVVLQDILDPSRDLVTIRPSAGLGVELNPLSLQLPPDEVATLTRDILQAVAADELGPRMRVVLHPLLQAAAEARATLQEVADAMTLDSARLALAEAASSPGVKRYLEHVLPGEPQATLSACVARIRHLMETRITAAMWQAKGCFAGDALFRPRLVIADLSGTANRLVARALFRLWSWSILNRRDTRRPFVLVVDEAQAVLVDPTAAEATEDLLQQCRWKGASVLVSTQAVNSIKVPAVARALHANAGIRLALTPSIDDLRELSGVLPRSSGLVVNRHCPDERLTGTQERELRHSQWSSEFGPRRGLLYFRGHVAAPVETLTTPVAELDRRYSALRPSVRRAWDRGAALTLEELEARRAQALSAPTPGAEPREGKATGRRYRAVELPQ